ncbi:MAG: hypothetical protein E7611_03175 [Ruminococcaceae bacterium]|nr:hypothetical protein [Oscillospiraceae bacterium]
MKRKVFTRCILIALISALIVCAAGIYITYTINRSIVRERLVTETKLAIALLDSKGDLEGFNIFYGDDSCRVTVMSMSGDVLFESDTHEMLGNHADREEVKAAIEGESVAVERYSETFKCRMTYYAVKTQFSSGEAIIVRLAIRSTETDSYIVGALVSLLVALAVGAATAAVFAKRLSKSVAKRITDISDSLRSVSEGAYVPISAEDSDSEFVQVYNEINGLNEKTVLSMKSSENERERLGAFLDAEKELARQKEEFFANASHELKTPLTAMLGLSELIMEKETDESTHRQIERIHKESVRLSFLISDMLKLSRLESEGEVEPRTAVEVAPLAHEVISELAPLIDSKEIKVSITGSVTVMASEKRIYEILQNLCTNAVNYNKQGGELAISLESEGESRIIRVCDTGIGIAKENIPHLCERFYRVDKSRSKKTGGTGLGLAIVKHICALYGAEMKIESEIDKGTTVSVFFYQ